MSSLSQFSGGNRPVMNIVNGISSGGLQNKFHNAGVGDSIGLSKRTLSGAMTANVLKTALNITGSGTLDTFFTSSVDATSRTHRIKITLDSVVIFDATSSDVVTTSAGLLAIGTLIFFDGPSNTCYPGPFSRAFNSSCLVEIASSVTETNLMYVYYSYTTVR